MPPRSCRRGRRTARRCGASRAARPARHRRPRAPARRAPVGLRRRGPTGRPRPRPERVAAGAVDGRVDALPTSGPRRRRAGATAGRRRRARRARQRLAAGPASRSTSWTRRAPSAWRAAGRRAAGARSRAFVPRPHPGLDVATPDGARPAAGRASHAQARAAAASCFFGRKSGCAAVLDQLAPGLRPGADGRRRSELPDADRALVQLQDAVRGAARRGRPASPGVSVPTGVEPAHRRRPRLVDEPGRLAARWAARLVAGRDPARAAAARPATPRGSPARRPARPAAVAPLRDGRRRCSPAAGAATPTASARWAGDAGLVERWRTAPRDARPRRPAAAVAAPLGRVPARPSSRCARRASARRTVSCATGAVQADDAVRALDRGARGGLGRRAADATGLDGFDPWRTSGRSTGSPTSAARRARPAWRPRCRARCCGPGRSTPAPARARSARCSASSAKQRRGLGVRALLAQYGDLITQVMPCVLVSPDSLARFFPARGRPVRPRRVRRGVADPGGRRGRRDGPGAVGRRGRRQQADAADVVRRAGHRRRTTTTDVPRTSSSSRTRRASSPSACRRGCRGTGCRGTTAARTSRSSRSATAHYYEDRLSSFPAPRPASSARHDGSRHLAGPGRRHVPPLRHRQGRCAPTRSRPQAIVAEIRRTVRRPPPTSRPSIGVVTFNAPAAAAASRRCCATPATTGWSRRSTTAATGCSSRTWRTSRATSATSILFSTAFSVNDKGVLPLNFGPLNLAGGERRLNVAVTRARRQVVVFSSFDPGQLRAEETTSVGIKHLRAYLDLAARRLGGRRRRPDRLGARHRPAPRRGGRPAAGRRPRGAHRRRAVGLPDRAHPRAPRTSPVDRWSPCCSTGPAGRAGGRSATATACRSRCCRGCWAGRRWSGSGCRPGSATPTPWSPSWWRGWRRCGRGATPATCPTCTSRACRWSRPIRVPAAAAPRSVPGRRRVAVCRGPSRSSRGRRSRSGHGTPSTPCRPRPRHGGCGTSRRR